MPKIMAPVSDEVASSPLDASLLSPPPQNTSIIDSSVPLEASTEGVAESNSFVDCLLDASSMMIMSPPAASSSSNSGQTHPQGGTSVPNTTAGGEKGAVGQQQRDILLSMYKDTSFSGHSSSRVVSKSIPPPHDTPDGNLTITDPAGKPLSSAMDHIMVFGRILDFYMNRVPYNPRIKHSRFIKVVARNYEVIMNKVKKFIGSEEFQQCKLSAKTPLLLEHTHPVLLFYKNSVQALAKFLSLGIACSRYLVVDDDCDDLEAYHQPYLCNVCYNFQRTFEKPFDDLVSDVMVNDDILNSFQWETDQLKERIYGMENIWTSSVNSNPSINSSPPPGSTTDDLSREAQECSNTLMALICDTVAWYNERGVERERDHNGVTANVRVEGNGGEGLLGLTFTFTQDRGIPIFIHSMVYRVNEGREEVMGVERTIQNFSAIRLYRFPRIDMRIRGYWVYMDDADVNYGQERHCHFDVTYLHDESRPLKRPRRSPQLDQGIEQ